MAIPRPGPAPGEFQTELSLFLSALRAAYGREPVIYAADDFSRDYLRGFVIRRSWVRAVVLTPAYDFRNPWMFWQFSERGKVPGITGYVDMDVFDGSEAQFQLLTSAANR